MPWFERLSQDVRHAGRVMRRRPGFTVAAVLSLALGIGANTAVFSLLNNLMLKNLPVPQPHELVQLVEPVRETSTYRDVFAYPAYDSLRRGSRLLSGVIVMSQTMGPTRIIDNGEEQPAFVQMVSDDYFDVLGIKASRGRVLSRDEPIAVISDAFWRKHYAADPAALGARFRYANHEFTVAGIAPREFRGTGIDFPADIWVSIEQVLSADSEERVRGRWLQIMGRLKAGETSVRAEAEANGLIGRPVRFQPGATGYSNLRGRLSRPLFLLELVVVLVMLLTCANLANLVLADTVSREHELSIRQAIGASRFRIIRQLFTESLLLSVTGGVLGLLTAYWMSLALLSFLTPEQAPAIANLRFDPDPRVVGFAGLLCLGTGVLFGLVPAMRATRPPVRHRQRSWMSRGLVICEVSMCTLLLIVAGLFVRTVQNLRWQDTGYQEDRLLVADVAFPRTYSEQRRDQLIEELRQRAGGLPGVEIAAFSHIGQLSGHGIEWDIHLPGDSNKEQIFEQHISPGFLDAMGTPIRAGRNFTDNDDEKSAPVAIINEAFARRLHLEKDPVGRRFIKEGGSRKVQTIEIVGVVADAKWVNLREESPAMYYIPYRQNSGTPVVRFAVRAHDDLNRVGAGLVETARAIDSRMSLSNVVPFSEIVNRTLMIERLVAQVSAAFGVLALLIAAVGLYGTLAYGVERRRREIGVRIAVGASPGTVEWMLLRESLVLLAVGFAAGIPAAIVVTRLVSSMLFGLTPEDPLTIAVTLGVLTITTVAAAYLPARRAAGIDPILALRAE